MWCHDVNQHLPWILKILVVRRITGRLTNGYPAAVLVVPDKRISVYFERWCTGHNGNDLLSSPSPSPSPLHKQFFFHLLTYHASIVSCNLFLTGIKWWSFTMHAYFDISLGIFYHEMLWKLCPVLRLTPANTSVENNCVMCDLCYCMIRYPFPLWLFRASAVVCSGITRGSGTSQPPERGEK